MAVVHGSHGGHVGTVVVHVGAEEAEIKDNLLGFDNRCQNF